MCDLSKTRNLAGGWFDGPRAWRILLQRLHQGKRSRADKDFYREAERLQRNSGSQERRVGARMREMRFINVLSG